MTGPLAWILPDPEATRERGIALGRAAKPGLVVALVGTLGAGKTAFVRAVAEGLEVEDPRRVTSPTFVLIQEYPARLPIFHFDVYRLSSPEEFLDLGVEEYFEAGGVCLIEWADRVADCLPIDHLELRFEVLGPSERRITVSASGNLSRGVAERWTDV